MLKVKYQRSYRSQKGNTVFVYSVAGDEKSIEAYKAAQGDNYRENEETKESLWFTTRFIGSTGSLVLTSKGKVVADMSAFEQAASLAAQFGGNFGQELAKQAAASLLGGNSGAGVTSSVAVNANPSGVDQF